MNKTVAVAGVVAGAVVMAAGLGVGLRVVRAQERAARFEVMSVRPGSNDSMRFVTWGPTASGYHAGNTPLVSVILEAYLVAPPLLPGSLSRDRVKGAPAWVMETPYNIEARADEATIAAMKGMSRAEQLAAEKPMLRAMLEERFKLAAHVATTDVQGYALVVSKGGVKMREVPAGEPLPVGGRMMSFGGEWKSGPLLSAELRQMGMRYAHITMGELATILGNGPTPVVDQTGLTGRYDFDLPYVAVDSPGGPADPSVDVAHKYDWGAIGLEMKPIKAPVMTVVVDHVERPTAN